MAIKGMTDQEKRYPRIGILRKGAAKTGNAPGKDLTYFRFVPDDEDAKQHFEAAYPDQESLRCINVLLPFKTPEENFINDTWIEKWVAGGLEYRSDGETIVLWRMPNGQYSDQPKPDPKPEILEDGKRADGSMQVGRLTCIIPELGRWATVTILTTSKNDVVNLSKQLKGYYDLTGDLRGTPFIVVRRKHMISTPTGGGKRGRRESWLLSIETQPHYTRLKLAEVQRNALPESVDDIEDAEFEQLPAIGYKPEDDAAPFDSEPEAEPMPTFANIDDLLFDACKRTGYSEQEAKDVLKEYGYGTFKPSKSGEMYQAIMVHHQSEQEADAILGKEQPELPK
jgi:hypothetical protein